VAIKKIKDFKFTKASIMLMPEIGIAIGVTTENTGLQNFFTDRAYGAVPRIHAGHLLHL